MWARFYWWLTSNPTKNVFSDGTLYIDTTFLWCWLFVSLSVWSGRVPASKRIGLSHLNSESLALIQVQQWKPEIQRSEQQEVIGYLLRGCLINKPRYSSIHDVRCSLVDCQMHFSARDGTQTQIWGVYLISLKINLEELWHVSCCASFGCNEIAREVWLLAPIAPWKSEKLYSWNIVARERCSI